MSRKTIWEVEQGGDCLPTYMGACIAVFLGGE